MAALTNSDIRSILQFLQKLHIGSDWESLPSHIISILPDVLPGEFFSCSTIDLVSQEMNFLASSIPNVEEELGIDQIANDYAKKNRPPEEHPVIHHYLKTGDGKASKLSDFSSKHDVEYLEGLYQLSMRLLGLEDLMMTFLPVDSTSTPKHERSESNAQLLTVNVLRSQRNFSDRDRRVLNILRPHLFQAYQNAQLMTKFKQEQAWLKQAIEQLNLIVLNGDGHAQFISQPAWKLLRHYFHVLPGESSRLPETLQRWVNHQIALSQQTDDISFTNLPLQAETDGKRLTIRFILDRTQGQHLLLLDEQIPCNFSLEALELLGLTRREAEVLFWVARDKSNEAIASILGCSAKTIKKHLENIYTKLGTQTRAGAVMLALERLGILN